MAIGREVGVRICLVITSLRGGGAERAATEMANYWSLRGEDVTIAVLSSDPPFYNIRPTVKVVSLVSSSAFGGIIGKAYGALVSLSSLRGFLADEKHDIVISFLAVSSGLAGLAMGGEMKTRLIAAERTNPELDPLHPIWRFLRNRTYRRVALVVAQTERAAEYCRRIGARSVTAIPNPIRSVDRIQVPGGRSRTVLSVGRMTREKGHDLLLEAFSLVKRNGWRLALIGDGSERKRLELLAAGLGIREATDFIGTAKAVDAYYSSAGIFVLPSRFEGFPNALCEAMASGAACISFDCPNGPFEIMKSGYDGLLVPAGDVEGLAAAIERLISDESERMRLGAAAVSVVERFGIGKVMAIWDRHIDLLTGKPRVSSRVTIVS
jgi:GalNAc-alpha-(1->4)-GalNAc-alpha-(1->3)-diNAcBac-PP-undecaprenol alpha-1,4-N-acetyl-D-galactosaminyltransferase